jgi:hypothetical protein
MRNLVHIIRPFHLVLSVFSLPPFSIPLSLYHFLFFLPGR